MKEYFRKFSFDLKYCDLSTIFWNVGVLLRGNCINIYRNQKPIPWIFYVLNFVFIASFVYAYLISLIWFTLVKCRETGDYTGAFVYFPIAACNGCFTKFAYMHLCSKAVINLVEKYLQCDSLVVPQTRYASKLVQNLRIVKKRATTIWTLFMTNGIVYVVTPFILPGRHLPLDSIVLWGLEPIFETPNYEIAMSLLILGVMFSVPFLCNTMMFILTSVGYIEAHMQALSGELANLWEDSKKFYDKYKTDAIVVNENDLESKIRNIFIRFRLRDIIKFHIMCIDLRDDVEKELHLTFLVEFILRACGTVCELLGGLQNTYFELPYTFLQLYMECFIGQRLLDVSDAFENSVYDCKWENFDISNKKTVLIMLHCAQKSLSLSAGGIAILNYFTLMNYTKTTYTAYTTMQSRINSQK